MPLKAPPRVKVVPKVVKAFNVLLAGVRVTEWSDGLNSRETTFTRKDGRDDGAEVLSGDGLEVGYLIFDVPVNRVELASAVTVGKGLMGWTLLARVPRPEDKRNSI